MKRLAIFAGLLLFIGSIGFSQDPAAPSFNEGALKFSLKLSGGIHFATLGDLAKGIDGQQAYLKDEYGDITGSYEAPRLGLGFGAEFLFQFAPRFAAGLGVGYLTHAKDSQVSYPISFIDTKEKIGPKLSVIPITANLHYLLPFGRKLKLDLNAGAGYYLATMNYEYRMDLSLLGYEGYDTYTFKSNRGTLGFQGGLGLEFAFGRRIALCLDIIGRLVSFDGFKGDWTEKGGGDFWEYDDAGTDHEMWYYVWTYGGKPYDLVVFQTEKPFGSLVSDVRSAKVDLTGVTATLSLKISLF